MMTLGQIHGVEVAVLDNDGPEEIVGQDLGPRHVQNAKVVAVAR